jgi:hypothetical protein
MKPSLPCCLRPVLCAVLLWFAIAPLPASVATATGSVEGRVLNVATGQYLNNARIAVQGSDQVAFTDETGTFRLARVPAGSETPPYAKHHRETKHGVQITVGVKGVF